MMTTYQKDLVAIEVKKRERKDKENNIYISIT